MKSILAVLLASVTSLLAMVNQGVGNGSIHVPWWIAAVLPALITVFAHFQQPPNKSN